jgi:hypothetical protein
MKVRANSTYRYHPATWDIADPPCGVQRGTLKPGDTVKVVNLPGCPKANTMGHCHILKDGQFAGLVQTNSLHR